jgi:uncharacterized repeat protein (TIGR01451 family)
MNLPSFLRNIAIATSLIPAASVLIAQTNSIQLLSPVNVRLSASNASYSNPVTFSSTTVQLSCPSEGPITAVLTSTPATSESPGSVLVDNYVNLTVTQGEFSSGPTNVCSGGVGGVQENGFTDCFTTNYQSPASAGQLTGLDPDTFPLNYGVGPIDVSSFLLPGSQQVQFDLVDTGGYLASTSLYLNTSCSQAGVTGPASITGQPISSSNPTPQQLTQSFPFDSTTGQVLNFTYDLSAAENADSLTITNGSTPNLADLPIDPTTWTNTWVPGTSFATSSCLTHTGELLPSGASACKLYTLQCAVGQGASETGAQCPVSTQQNEVFQELFDGPAFTLPDIVNTGGSTFHQGVGFLMASEGWMGGQCQFDQSTDFATTLCPQNLLVNFSGPGGYTSTSHGTHPNSSFITLAPVPEDLTTVTVAGQKPGGWINSDTANVTFSSQPPTFAGVTSPPPGASNFVAAPIASITYGVSPAASVPSPPAPIPGDTTLTNSIACPTSSNPTSPAATTFTPGQQTVTFTSDGMYLIHYYARDCASTEELKFTQDMSGNWSTAFYTFPVNVDTQPPAVASGPTLSPAPSTNYGVPNSYIVGQTVTASYSCTDALSGVVKCGTATFPGGTLNTGTVTSPVNTSSAGQQTFTVNVTDAAGNNGTPAPISYTVVSAPPVNLAMVKLAPPTVRQNSLFEYDIAVSNFGANSATDVVVSDPLPAGVTFAGVNAQLYTCGRKGCGYQPEGAQCSSSGNTVTCSLASLDPTNWFNIALYNIEITVRATGAPGAVISNTATVTSNNPDTNPNSRATAVTRIVGKNSY